MPRPLGSYTSLNMELEHGGGGGSTEAQDWATNTVTSPRSQQSTTVWNQSSDMSLPALQRSASGAKVPAPPEDGSHGSYSKNEKKDEKVVIGEKEVHLIPLMLIICAAILYIYNAFNPEPVHLHALKLAPQDIKSSSDSSSRRLLSWGDGAVLDSAFTSLARSFVKLFDKA